MSVYEKYIKRGLDIIIALVGLCISIIFIVIAGVFIFIEDPGPIMFRQKRVGRGKTYFNIHKLRSMKLDTPDIPTHLLDNPDQYVLKSGKIIRKLSIDELPQFWDILIGKMSLIGPRPALWNQYDLIAERDKYRANDVKPGLTGWAQINGRDELDIATKARFDGDYCKEMMATSWRGFAMDCRVFFKSISAVLKSSGVVEGGVENKK